MFDELVAHRRRGLYILPETRERLNQTKLKFKLRSQDAALNFALDALEATAPCMKESNENESATASV